jgi:hypothetical protein
LNVDAFILCLIQEYFHFENTLIPNRAMDQEASPGDIKMWTNKRGRKRERHSKEDRIE